MFLWLLLLLCAHTIPTYLPPISETIHHSTCCVAHSAMAQTLDMSVLACIAPQQGMQQMAELGRDEVHGYNCMKWAKHATPLTLISGAARNLGLIRDL